VPRRCAAMESRGRAAWAFPRRHRERVRPGDDRAADASPDRSRARAHRASRPGGGSGAHTRVNAAADQSGRVTAVIRDGVVDRVTADGLACADTGERVVRTSRFYVGSLAKQFVAACARSLADRGVLDIEAPVSAYAADLPAWGDEVRVRHL